MKKSYLLAFVLALVIGVSNSPMAYADSTPYVQSDTTASFYLPQGQTYQVKFTVHGTHANPNIAAGDGRILQTQSTTKTKDSNGNDVYYFKVKANGSVGSTSAIYTTLPGASAVQHFVITVSKTYPAGMYKVGSDIPSGDYLLIPKSGAYLSSFEITSSADGKSDSIVSNDNFSGREIISISDGQYLNVSDATIYKLSEAPVINKSAKEFSEGMYRVDVDIPAGDYKVVPTDSISGYYEITSDDSHTFNSVIGNETVDHTLYLTLESGQYIKLERAKLVVK
jgi:hypothetical protein